jgi:hypothetical protein
MSNSWLGKPAPFREVYPNVKSLRLEGTQHGDLRSEYQATLHFSESNIPATIDCANPRCQQGGYRIQPLLDALVHAKESRSEQTWHCNGHEGSPKGRRKGDPCMNYIKFTLTIEYKDE